MVNVIKDSLKVIIISFIVSSGVYFVFAQTWTGPTALPPGGNRPAPLTLNDQGRLGIGTTTVDNTITIDGTIYASDGLPIYQCPDVRQNVVGSGSWTNCTGQITFQTPYPEESACRIYNQWWFSPPTIVYKCGIVGRALVPLVGEVDSQYLRSE